MARVRIDTGPIDHDTRFVEVPADRKGLLLGAWHMFCQVRVPADCRELLRIVADAEANRAWEAMGFADLRSLIRDGLEIDPEMVGWAIKGLQSLQPSGPVPLAEAVAAGLRVAKAAKATTGDVLPGNGYVAERDEGAQIAHPNSQAKRAAEKGISRRTQQKLDKVAKLRPDLLEEVRAGHKSAHRAALEAGIVKPPSPLAQLRSAWKRTSDEDKAVFRREIG